MGTLNNPVAWQINKMFNTLMKPGHYTQGINNAGTWEDITVFKSNSSLEILVH